MNEIWRPVVGYEGHYLVSNLGRVKSVDKMVNGRYGNKYFRSGRIRRLKTERQGYLRLNLAKNGAIQFHFVHRLVAAAFIPNPLKLPLVNHLDGDKTNNCASNLEWCTQSENCFHAVRNDLYEHARGERISTCKITERDVLSIRSMAAHGMVQLAIANMFGLDQSNVSLIVRRKRWKHIA